MRGGQQALLEYARNTLGIADAQHEETAPTAPTLVVSKLACSLVEKTQAITCLAGSLFQRSYGHDDAAEPFVCRYGLTPAFRDSIENGPLAVTGEDRDGGVRAIERTDHPFFAGTLYQPHVRSTPTSSHPLIVAYGNAVLAFRTPTP